MDSVVNGPEQVNVPNQAGDTAQPGADMPLSAWLDALPIAAAGAHSPDLAARTGQAAPAPKGKPDQSGLMAGMTEPHIRRAYDKLPPVLAPNMEPNELAMMHPIYDALLAAAVPYPAAIARDVHRRVVPLLRDQVQALRSRCALAESIGQENGRRVAELLGELASMTADTLVAKGVQRDTAERLVVMQAEYRDIRDTLAEALDLGMAHGSATIDLQRRIEALEGRGPLPDHEDVRGILRDPDAEPDAEPDDAHCARILRDPDLQGGQFVSTPSQAGPPRIQALFEASWRDQPFRVVPVHLDSPAHLDTPEERFSRLALRVQELAGPLSPDVMRLPIPVAVRASLDGLIELRAMLSEMSLPVPMAGDALGEGLDDA